jgi:DnaJ-class molecular chaperone
MPGFAEDDSVDNGAGGGEDRSQEAASTKSSAARMMGRAEPARSVESTRLRLEMMWQLEEAAEDCEVERPETCGSRPCGRCRGRGANACRFCSGRQVLGFRRERPDGTTQPALYGCTVCDRGFEACDACRGTGWVAEWALLTPGTSTPAAAH